MGLTLFPKFVIAVITYAINNPEYTQLALKKLLSLAQNFAAGKASYSVELVPPESQWDDEATIEQWVKEHQPR